jgi:N-acetylneuraminate synthase/N,N'-diacetyllegionaminate synthase
MVDAASKAGADAVKFQMFRAADLVAAAAPPARYQKEHSGECSQREMLARLELSVEGFARIKRRCEQRSLLFIATPFGPREVAGLVELGAAAIKIASTDLTNISLLEAAAESGLPIILSTGASTAAEMHSSVNRLREFGAGSRLVLLHCVSCYPTPLQAINLRAVESLARTFGVPCGLSDHTLSTEVGAWAVAAGACVLEKHFTLDPTARGPDHAMSLNPRQIADYISAVRQVEQALGGGSLGMTDIEGEVRSVAGRSVVAAVDIPAGTRLTAKMLTVKRPGTGIAPSELHRLVDRRAAGDIPCDTILTWDMIR